MKFNGKHIAITAGLGAVLALSPVVGPMATAFAQSNNGAAATQAQAHSVKVIIDGANYGNWGMPDNAGYVSDLAKDNVPEGYEFLGTWSVVWGNGSTTAGKSLDELDVPGLVYGYPAHAGVRLLHSGHCRHDALRQVAAECRAAGRGHHG